MNVITRNYLDSFLKKQKSTNEPLTSCLSVFDTSLSTSHISYRMLDIGKFVNLQSALSSVMIGYLKYEVLTNI